MITAKDLLQLSDEELDTIETLLPLVRKRRELERKIDSVVNGETTEPKEIAETSPPPAEETHEETSEETEIPTESKSKSSRRTRATEEEKRELAEAIGEALVEFGGPMKLKSLVLDVATALGQDPKEIENRVKGILARDGQFENVARGIWDLASRISE